MRRDALVAEGETAVFADTVSTKSRGSQIVETRCAALPFEEYGLLDVVAELGF